MTKKALIRWLSYPLIMVSVIALELLILYKDIPYWPLSPLIVAVGILGVAILELSLIHI